jgi:hypothetical protein
MVTTVSQLACAIKVIHTLVSQLDLAIKVMQISGSWIVHVYHHSNTLYTCIYLLPMSHFVPLLPLPVHHHLNEHTNYLDPDQPDIWSQSARQRFWLRLATLPHVSQNIQ